MAERLTRRTQDLEVQVSSLARRVVSLDKELYSTYLSKSQLTRNTEFFALGVLIISLVEACVASG